LCYLRVIRTGSIFSPTSTGIIISIASNSKLTCRMIGDLRNQSVSPHESTMFNAGSIEVILDYQSITILNEENGAPPAMASASNLRPR